MYACRVKDIHIFHKLQLSLLSIHYDHALIRIKQKDLMNFKHQLSTFYGTRIWNTDDIF